LWEYDLPARKNSIKESEIEIHRVKGRLLLDNGSTRIVQGVREVFEIIEAPRTGDGEEAGPGKVVLIGRDLKEKEVADSFNWFVVEGGGGAS
jgi:G3E family GTPase